MQFCLGNFSSGELMVFLEKLNSNESRQDTKGGGFLHQASEERPMHPPQPREGAVREGRDGLSHPSVNSEWNVQALSGQSVCLAHWNEGL